MEGLRNVPAVTINFYNYRWGGNRRFPALFDAALIERLLLEARGCRAFIRIWIDKGSRLDSRSSYARQTGAAPASSKSSPARRLLLMERELVPSGGFRKGSAPKAVLGSDPRRHHGQKLCEPLVGRSIKHAIHRTVIQSQLRQCRLQSDHWRALRHGGARLG